jgi:hypothetical protein
VADVAVAGALTQTRYNQRPGEFMRRSRVAVGLIAAAFVTTGCYDIEQTLTIDRNLSGKAGFRMRIDMEPMVLVMARMGHEMSGKTGEPSAEDIAKVRKDMLSKSKPMDASDFAEDRKQIQSKLPKGVTLLDATFREEELAMTMGFVFGFDHPSKLSQIQFPKDPKKNQTGGDFAAAGPGAESPIDSPFGGLTVTDQGATILVTSPPQNPVADQAGPDAKKPSPEDKKMMDDLFKNLRVAFKITSPLAIVEHNAHKKEGTTLIWEYTIKSFETMTEAQLNQSIKVRYRK